MISASFEPPASVSAYLSDPVVRTGVDALLAIETDDLPIGLEWGELQDYLAARTAAELTRHEWATMARRLWTMAWKCVEADVWRQVPLSVLVAEECAVTPYACWDIQGFSLYHEYKGLFLYTGVGVTRIGTQLAFSLENSKRILLGEDADQFRWSEQGTWSGWSVASVPHVPGHPDFNIAELQHLADAAMARVQPFTRT